VLLALIKISITFVLTLAQMLTGALTGGFGLALDK
jgi:hypothetical protein